MAPFGAKWRHQIRQMAPRGEQMAPFGAKIWRVRTIAKWRQMAPSNSPNGAIWRQIWRHVAPRGATWRHLAIANLRHSPKFGDTWRYRHVAMVHSLKKSMRKIFIAKWRHMAPFGDKCSSSQMAPYLAKFRQTSPYGAIWRGVAKIIDELTIYLFDFNALQSRTVAIRRHVAPFGDKSLFGSKHRQMAPFGANHRQMAPLIAR